MSTFFVVFLFLSAAFMLCCLVAPTGKLFKIFFIVAPFVVAITAAIDMLVVY